LDKILSIPLSGGVFLKYGRRGAPHHRFVWLSHNMAHISWADLKKKQIEVLSRNAFFEIITKLII
jgi:hypothetical protein